MIWSSNTITSADAWTGIAYGITYNGPLFVTVASGTANSAVSTDGIHWTAGNNLPKSTYWQDIAYGNDRFVSVSIGGDSTSSIDGINWHWVALPYQAYWQGIAFGVSRHVAVANGIRGMALTADPHDWSCSNFDSANPWIDVAFGNGNFVALSNTNATAISQYHGASWVTTYNLPVSQAWSSIEFGGGKFVAIGYGSSTAAYSTDGIHWTATSLPAASNWTSVAYGNSTWVAVASGSGNAAISIDGITWTNSVMPSTQNWCAITFGSNKFVSVATNSNVAAVFG